MKPRLYLYLLMLFTMFTVITCKKNKETGNTETSTCYTGRLEIKGLCLNYTIKLLKGPLDTNLIEKSWQDPQTGKTYENVFALGSYCTFPPDIKQGDEFYFTLDDKPSPLQCVVCQAYYPKPTKHLSIVVSKTACR